MVDTIDAIPAYTTGQTAAFLLSLAGHALVALAVVAVLVRGPAVESPARQP